MPPSLRSRLWSLAKIAAKVGVGVVAALIGTSLIASLITVEWEGRERDAAIRAALVTDISTSLARARTSARFIATGAFAAEEPKTEVRLSRLEQKYNAGILKWEEDAARITSQAQAYFKEDTVAKEWAEYSRVMMEFYQLSRLLPPKTQPERRLRNLRSRRKWAGTVQGYLYDTGNKISWSTLVNRANENDEFSHQYLQLSDVLHARQEVIAKDILELPTVYSQPTFRLLPRL